MIEKQLKLYKKLLDEQKFFQAHEALEVIWFDKRFEENNEMKLLKGFINAAVSFELLKRGKYKAAKTPWKTYLKYRTLLFKTNSKHLNEYYQTTRHVEMIKNTRYKTK